MSNNPSLDELIALCLEAERLGVPLEFDRLIKQFPEHADELTDFFSGHERLMQFAPRSGRKNDDDKDAANEVLLWQQAAQSSPTAATLPFLASENGVRHGDDGCLRLGRYRLLRELGRGGMGVVYEAWQEGVNRQVAVKVISAGPFASPEELKRFRVEAESAANLSHPGLVPIYEVDVCEGRPFYSMELVSGPSLAELSKSGNLSFGKAAAIVAEIADAVEYAHRRGVLHRDLKPANVIIDSTGRPRVLDFGLAKRFAVEKESVDGTASQNTITQTGAVLGTPSFMAPEQALGVRNVGPSADIYSLGAILYQLLTGRPPFRGPTPIDTLALVTEGRLEPVRNLNPEVPADLATIVETCLEKEPGDRYRTAADLASDLRRFLADEPIRAGGMSLWGRVARAVGQSRHISHFRQWGRTITGFGLAIVVAHCVMQLLAWNDYDTWEFMTVPRLVMFGAMFLMLRHSRSGSLMPRDAVERLVWVVWTAYLLGYAAATLATAVAGRDHNSVYPYAAALAGAAWFTLGCHVWGACYLVGGAFFVAAPLLAATPHYAILGFGTLWGVSLCSLGIRYEWLNRVLPADD